MLLLNRAAKPLSIMPLGLVLSVLIEFVHLTADWPDSESQRERSGEAHHIFSQVCI